MSLSACLALDDPASQPARACSVVDPEGQLRCHLCLIFGFPPSWFRRADGGWGGRMANPVKCNAELLRSESTSPWPGGRRKGRFESSKVWFRFHFLQGRKRDERVRCWSGRATHPRVQPSLGEHAMKGDERTNRLLAKHFSRRIPSRAVETRPHQGTRLDALATDAQFGRSLLLIDSSSSPHHEARLPERPPFNGDATPSLLRFASLSLPRGDLGPASIRFAPRRRQPEKKAASRKPAPPRQTGIDMHAMAAWAGTEPGETCLPVWTFLHSCVGMQSPAGGTVTRSWADGDAW